MSRRKLLLVSMGGSGTGTTPPSDPPPPPPPPSCPASLQDAIDAASGGDTIDVTGCTFRETVTVDKALTIIGGTIDGEVTRTKWMNVTADNVTLRGMTMVNCDTGSFQSAGLDVSGANFTGENLTLLVGPYACARLWLTATDAILTDCDMSSGPVVGLLGFQADRAVVAGGRYHHNEGSTDVGNESGGIKFGESTNLSISSIEADNNVGPGVWLDISCDDSTISGVHAHHNSRSGIMVEITDTATVSGCTSHRNGTEAGGNAYESRSGILVSSSRNVTVSGNTVAWNSSVAADISFISQDRDPKPHDGNSATGNVVRSAVTAIKTPTIDSGYKDWADTGGSYTVSGNTLVLDSDSRISGL